MAERARRDALDLHRESSRCVDADRVHRDHTGIGHDDERVVADPPELVHTVRDLRGLVVLG